MRRTTIPLVLAFFLVTQAISVSEAQESAASKHKVLRGRVISLDKEGRRIDSKDYKSNEAPELFGLESSDGKFYRFLSSDVMTEMFKDPRVRARQLQVTVSRHGDDQVEIVKVMSIQEGKLYDIFYYCEVCSITVYGPGPCVCCGENYELRVTPAPW